MDSENYNSDTGYNGAGENPERIPSGNGAASHDSGAGKESSYGNGAGVQSGHNESSYTGEYGNNVNNGFRSSEYRFKPDDSTASGDYHDRTGYSGSSQNSGGGYSGGNYGAGNGAYSGGNYGSGSGNQSSGSGSVGNENYSAGNGNGNYASGRENYGSGNENYGPGDGNPGGAGNSGYNTSGQPYGGQNQSGQPYGSRDSYGNYNSGFNGGGPGFHGRNSEKKRKEKKKREPGQAKGGSFGKKAALTAVLGIILGAVAGLCFQGVNYMFGRSGGSSSKVTIGSTADTKNTGKTTSASTGTAVTKIVENTMPSIVTIACTSESQGYFDIFGGYTQGQKEVSAGTGFIIGKDSDEILIATNNHVIQGAKTISVKFADNKVYEAKTKGSDSSNDLAVIAVKLSKVKKETLGKIKIAALGSSDDLKVGEQCVAIGNALGYGQSVTVGYISAKDRQITETDENTGAVTAQINVLQTDAAINPGNSGGPLLNMNGMVIGITSAKIASSSVEGVGYAIPISYASPVFEDLINNGNLDDKEKGYLGITGQSVDDQMQSYGMPEGVYVADVAKGGAAAKGGILKGDVITGVDDEKITSMERLQSKINSSRKGTTVTITLKRLTEGKYKEKKVKVKLQGAESLDSLQSGSGKNSSGNSGNSENGSSGNNGGSNDEGQNGYDSDGDDDFFSFFN